MLKKLTKHINIFIIEYNAEIKIKIKKKKITERSLEYHEKAANTETS